MSMANPMFVRKTNRNRHVTVFVGMMTSVTREREDYRYLAEQLKNHGVDSLVCGTDREYALEQGLENVFPIDGPPESSDNIHLVCFQHLEDYARRVLSTTKIPEHHQKEILRDTFGGEYKGNRVLGIVDLESELEVDQALRDKRKEWPDQFIK